MAVKPTPEEKRELQHLRGSRVEDFLSRCYTDTADRLVDVDDPELIRRLQGRARFIDEVLKLIHQE